MMCEYVDALLSFDTYVMDGESYDWESNEVSLLDVAGHTALAILILLFIAWWMVPIRLLLSDIKFKRQKT